MVAPLCPPTTGIAYFDDSCGIWRTSVTKVEARTMSRVETPKSLHKAIQTIRKTACKDGKAGVIDTLLGVEGAGLLECLGKDGDGRVDRVGDDADECIWAVLSDPVGEI